MNNTVEKFNDFKDIIEKRYEKFLTIKQIERLKELINQNLEITIKQAIEGLNVLDPINVNVKDYLNGKIGSESEDGGIINQIDRDISNFLSTEVDKFINIYEDNSVNFSERINPKSKEYTSYLPLIATEAINLGNGIYRWPIIDQQADQSRGVINLSSQLQPIYKMRIRRIVLSNVSHETFDAIVNSISNRFVLFIRTLGEQYLISPTGKWHFMFKLRSDIYGNTLTLTPFFFNRGWFSFALPHNNPDNIDINLYDVFTGNNIELNETITSITGQQFFDFPIFVDDFGYFYLITIDKTSFDMIPATEKYFNAIYPLSEYNGYLNGRMALQVSGFTTNDPVADAALIAEYNSAHQIIKLGRVQNNFTVWCVAVPVDISGASLVSGTSQEITITWNAPPNLTTVLEFKSHIAPDKKILPR